mmetsp:Transcript_19901/g.47361  ORF Transcript_19901/g.47361 Transcript_19901/m.47361 type:complete len:516 (+) Transcript_19901:664-2211(+)
MMLELTSDATIFFPGFIATFDARPALDANNLPKPTRFPGIFAPGQWHHIAASVAASGRVRFFLDGALVHTATDGRAIDAPLSGGFAVGQRFLGPDRSVAGRFEGSVDEVRLWRGQREGGVMMGAGCQEVAGTQGLLLCLGFEEGQGRVVGDSVVEGGGARGVAGDKHLPWCYVAGSASDSAGEGPGPDTVSSSSSWGFCSPEQPRLPGAQFEYRPEELRAVADKTLTEILPEEGGCGWYPLQFSDNRAEGGNGGGLYEAACATALDSRGVCFITGMVSSGGGMTLASFSNNTAAGAGGAAYVECSVLGSSCEALLEAELAWPLSRSDSDLDADLNVLDASLDADRLPRKVLLASNAAGTRVGGRASAIATGPNAIVLASDVRSELDGRWQAPMQAAYVPGQSLLNISVALVDAVGSLVVGSETLPNTRQVAILLCAVAGEWRVQCCHGPRALGAASLLAGGWRSAEPHHRRPPARRVSGRREPSLGPSRADRRSTYCAARAFGRVSAVRGRPGAR